MIQLNLGSGNQRRSDFLSVDLYVPGVDIEHDLLTPLPYGDGEVDAIFASHVVEHFSRAEWERVSADWARVIKPGGTIEIQCPDIVKVCRWLVANPEEPWRIAQIYGLQSHPGEYHKNGFTCNRLAAAFPNFSYKVLPPAAPDDLHMIFTKQVK